MGQWLPKSLWSAPASVHRVLFSGEANNCNMSGGLPLEGPDMLYQFNAETCDLSTFSSPFLNLNTLRISGNHITGLYGRPFRTLQLFEIADNKLVHMPQSWFRNLIPMITQDYRNNPELRLPITFPAGPTCNGDDRLAMDPQKFVPASEDASQKHSFRIKHSCRLVWRICELCEAKAKMNCPHVVINESEVLAPIASIAGRAAAKAMNAHHCAMRTELSTSVLVLTPLCSAVAALVGMDQVTDASHVNRVSIVLVLQPFHCSVLETPQRHRTDLLQRPIASAILASIVSIAHQTPCAAKPALQTHTGDFQVSENGKGRGDKRGGDLAMRPPVKVVPNPRHRRCILPPSTSPAHSSGHFSYRYYRGSPQAVSEGSSSRCDPL